MPHILVLNGGSSSLKFAVFSESLARTLTGKIERITLPGTKFSFKDSTTNEQDTRDLPISNFAAAGQFLLDWLDQRVKLDSIEAIGHRVVHGGPKYSEPQRVSDELLAELRRIAPFDPEHMPAEIALIELTRKRFPNVPQITCFDTAFHATLPRVARILPIPRKYEALGVQRYGFHGISYQYLMQELLRLDKRAMSQWNDKLGFRTDGKVILCHFGNGASLAAVRDGKCIDTSMAFTPAAGILMGTRTGNLDPGLVKFLFETEHLSADQFHSMVNHESGLRGVSETSSDMRDLLAKESSDVRAAEAVALFCYEAKKWIGAFAAALGGLDILVFSGGIGEHAPVIRERICSGMEFLGIWGLDDELNATNAPVISIERASVRLRVIPTDEELMIAQSVAQFSKP